MTASAQSAASLTIGDVEAGLASAASGSTGSALTVGGTLNNSRTIDLTGSKAAAALNITDAVTNNGSVSLTGKASLKGGAFTTNGIVGIDDGSGDAGGGGATLGALINSGDFDIGNTSLASALLVTASRLSNAASGTIHLVGGTWLPPSIRAWVTEALPLETRPPSPKYMAVPLVPVASMVPRLVASPAAPAIRMPVVYPAISEPALAVPAATRLLTTPPCVSSTPSLFVVPVLLMTPLLLTVQANAVMPKMASPL